MATYIISYDLNSPGQDYNSLFEVIKSFGNWWHCLDSTWAIETPSSAEQILDRLSQELDANDALLVVKSAGIGAWAGFNTECSTWLTDNL